MAVHQLEQHPWVFCCVDADGCKFPHTLQKGKKLLMARRAARRAGGSKKLGGGLHLLGAHLWSTQCVQPEETHSVTLLEQVGAGTCLS